MVHVAESPVLGEIEMFKFEAGVDHQHLTIEGSESTVFCDVRIYFHHTLDFMVHG